MDLDDLRRGLHEAADGAGTDVTAARAAVGASARRRRNARRTLVSVVGVVTAAAIVLALLALPDRSHNNVLRVTPSTSAGHAGAPARVSVAQLVAGHWANVPPAPIPARAGAAVVWTGSALIVWGGEAGARQSVLRNDGAAYDPSTNSWKRLPPAPISPRTGAAAVWTGTEMLVWGGADSESSLAGDTHVTADGAAYDPRTDSWRRLAASPLAARSDPIAVWTGDRLLVLGGQPAETGAAESPYADGATYDPATDRWQMLPTPVPLLGHPLTWDTAVQAGAGRLLAWSQWSKTNATGPGSAEMSGGADLFVLDETTATWHDVSTATGSTASGALPSIDTVLWTGDRAVVRGITYNCGACPGPFVPEATALYDPATNTWKRLPADPLGGDDMSSAWVGSALFSFDSGFQTSGSASGTVNPGDASLYDPVADRWTRLLTAPIGCDDSGPPIWTGRELLTYCASVASTAGRAYVPAPPTAPAVACPATSTVRRVHHAQRAGTGERMVPGTPVELLGCRYHGLQAPPSGSLAAQAVLAASATARDLDAIPLLKPGMPTPNCPDGNGERYLLRFVYAQGPPLDVTITNDGCWMVDNGDVTAMAASTLLTELDAVLGQDPS